MFLVLIEGSIDVIVVTSYNRIEEVIKSSTDDHIRVVTACTCSHTQSKPIASNFLHKRQLDTLAAFTFNRNGRYNW